MVDGRRLRFQLFGLYNAVMVMNDTETGSIWSHIGGDALDGPLKGTQLDFIPLQLTSWENWLELHPDSLVLSNNTEYQEWYSDPGFAGPALGPEFVASIVYWDERLEHNQIVLGVGIDGMFRAYLVSDIVALGGVVNDELADKEIVLVVDAQSAFSIAFSREVNGETLHFENASDEGLVIVDRESGSTWSIDGHALDGPLQGESLTFVTSFLTEWYGWSAFHPETEIYEPPAP